KAKTGLLRNDTTIQTLLTKMRQTVYSVVDGVGVTFTKIGITTSKNYEDKGKLVIDEKKLKEALEEDADSVMNLFCRSSTSHPGLSTVRTLDSTQRSIRTAEEGIAFRLFDILQDNISTYRNSSDRKGTLIEMAGFAGDSSEFNNIINDNIDDYQDRIDEMLVKLEDKEEYYYNMFSVMESYINTMNSQLSILQYFSSGG
ncbi:MAG TPA: flagellar hook protein, partial [Ruminiclostridium sp.]|nr:flagellar hook protein [Ruminiclostridium sp.]